MYAEGWSAIEIAAEVGLSRKQVHMDANGRPCSVLITETFMSDHGCNV